ncbi:MAG: glycosyltransferase family 9 protein [Pseudomonadota bacterium]
MRANQSTLVIKLGALGDMVQALPMFDVLRQRFGDNLTLLTTAPFAEFAKRSGHFKAIICDDRTSLKTNLGVLCRLRKHYFARIIDLQNVDRTRLYRFLLKGRFGQWIASPRNQKHTHPYEQYTDLCAAQKWPALPPIDIRMMAEPFDTLPPKPYVMVVAGASNVHGGRKRWSQENYAALCSQLLKEGITTILVGSVNDNLAELESLCVNTGVINLIGKTSLYQLITLGMNANGAIGNDTGPQLIIAASGCPTVTLFSSVNPPSKGGAWPWDQTRYKNISADDLTELSVDAVWDVLHRHIPLS